MDYPNEKASAGKNSLLDHLGNDTVVVGEGFLGHQRGRNSAILEPTYPARSLVPSRTETIVANWCWG
jgi:hypothetical protein